MYDYLFCLFRERAPFIFTSQYLAIVGGKDSENFKHFVDVCGKAYNIIRKHSDLFMNLFQLMVTTGISLSFETLAFHLRIFFALPYLFDFINDCVGIPELTCLDDIDYLRRALAPGLSDEDAATDFSKNILVALNTKTVIINGILFATFYFVIIFECVKISFTGGRIN